MARRRRGKLVSSAIWIVIGGGLIATAGLLSSRPRDVESSAERAAERSDAGDLYGALSDYDRALSQLPPDRADLRQRRYELLALRGDCQLALERTAHALADYREAQQLMPSDWIAWDRVGRAHLALDQYEAAALQFEEAAAAFPAREQRFRHAAAAALWRAAQTALEEAEADLEKRSRIGRQRDLVRALERFAAASAQAPTRADIEQELLAPESSGVPNDAAFAQLLAARSLFERADAGLADFDLSRDLDLGFGVIRAEMHLQAGRWYELRRLVEMLLELPGAREAPEAMRLRTALANGMHQTGMIPEAIAEFRELNRAQWNRSLAAESRAERDRLAQASYTSWIAMVRTRIEQRDAKEAAALLMNIAPPAPDNLRMSFYIGYKDFLLGDRNAALPLLERCATTLLAMRGRYGQLNDPDERLLIFERLVEALGACGREELAAQIVELALPIAPDPAPLLDRKITLLHPLRAYRQTLVADGFRLLALGRDGGRWLRRYEEDWKQAWSRAEPLEVAVAEQAQRVLRVFRSNDELVDPARRELALMALGDRKQKTLPPGALSGASTALLGDLAREPCLALQVVRSLLAAGHRDQAYLLLYGLANDHPQVLDFQLMLARHEIGDGRLAEASRSLARLLEHAPDDVEIVLLATQVALDRDDVAGAHAIEAAVLARGAVALSRRVAAQVAIELGQLDLATAAAGPTDLTTADGRALAGIAALAEARRGADATAEAQALAVLAVDPAEATALETLLTIRGRGGDAAAASRCDAELAARGAALDQQDEVALLRLAAITRASGAASATEQLARRALAQKPAHDAAELLLADALLLQSRWNEVLELLQAPNATHDALPRQRRVALALAGRDGALAAWTWLRDQVEIGAAEAPLARWLALLSAATGRLLPALDLLERHPSADSADDDRFVLAALAIHAEPLTGRVTGSEVIARLERQRLAEGDAGREIDRWISLGLTAPTSRFSEELCAILLLRDLPELASLRRAREERIETLFGPLGMLARTRASDRLALGDEAGAVAELVARLRVDSRDAAALRALLPFLPLLNDADVLAVAASPAHASLTEAELALVTAAVARRAGDDPAADAALREAAADPATRPTAQLELSRRALAGPPTGSASRVPWCAAAEANQADSRAEGAAVAAALVAIAHDPICDPPTRSRLAAMVERACAVLPPTTARALNEALVAVPGPWFAAYAATATELAAGAPDAEARAALDASLAEALVGAAGAPLPWPAIEAMAQLAVAARRAGDASGAGALLERLRVECPAHPVYLNERGFAALAAGDPQDAARHFELAAAFGARDAEALTWLAERKLTVDDAPRAAVALAMAAVAATPGELHRALRARAYEIAARANFVVGAANEARSAWEESARARGEEPKALLAPALEAFARRRSDARARLEPIAAATGPGQALALRLLDVLAERERTGESAKN